MKGSRLRKGMAQQFVMDTPFGFARVQACFTQVDLELKLKISLGCLHPNGSRRSGKRFKQAPEHLAIKYSRRLFTLAKAGYLLEPLVETAPFLFESTAINVRTDAH
jgi:hypothetical protein